MCRNGDNGRWTRVGRYKQSCQRVAGTGIGYASLAYTTVDVGAQGNIVLAHIHRILRGGKTSAAGHQSTARGNYGALQCPRTAKASRGNRRWYAAHRCHAVQRSRGYGQYFSGGWESSISRLRSVLFFQKGSLGGSPKCVVMLCCPRGSVQ